MKEEQRY